MQCIMQLVLAFITGTEWINVELKADIIHNNSLQNETGRNSKIHIKIKYLSDLFMAQTFVQDWVCNSFRGCTLLIISLTFKFTLWDSIMHHASEIGIKLFLFKGMTDTSFHSIIEIVPFCCWSKKSRIIEHADCSYGLNNTACK